ncbi:restriction endonuclease subunit S [Vibrio alginolyticus]|uniref:restriction endonuclease subunit S n=1 Tax=Vibrio TaxID=662 RepID=UPI0021CE6EB5|nr:MULTISPECIES: restriction endonuclease subunit S [Vibrio]MCE9845311.1 restriction endonuclease subunit S [Vibrio antiquarius]MCR9675001.1 restriction endonuclease subunit S [Vibrio alginolyticus]MDW1973579.1 restriction endonuclease subunit S [Vibrio sp. Vb1980]
MEITQFTLNDIAHVKGGKRLPKGYTLLDEATEHPYIRVSDFNESGSIDLDRIKYISAETHNKIARYTISDDDLYISIAGTIGKTGIVPSHLSGANLTENAAKIVFKDKEKQLLKYVYYFTKTYSFIEQIGLATKTVAQPKLALKRLGDVQIPIPPISEQKRIVEKLDALLTRIDTAIEHLQESTTLADSLFKSTLSSLVCDESQKYEKLSLEELGSFSGGGTPSKSKSEFWNGEILWVTPKDMKSPVITDSELKITKEGVSGSSAKFIPPKSILIVARSGILRHTLPVCINEAECTVNQDIKVFIPSERISSEYTQHMLKGYESFILSELVKGGVTVESLKYKDFQNFKFPVPSVEQQKKIVGELSKISQLTTPVKAELVDKIEQLKQLKESILDSAFKGEL